MNPAPSPGKPPRARRSALPGAVLGAALSGLLLAVAWLAGALPAGAEAHAAGGLALAWLAGGIGVLLQARLLASPADGGSRLQGGAVQRTLGLDFLQKVLLAAVGVGTLWLLDVKFDRLAAFALAYAGGTLVFQLAAAVVLARSTAQGREAAAATPDPGRRPVTPPATGD